MSRTPHRFMLLTALTMLACPLNALLAQTPAPQAPAKKAAAEKAALTPEFMAKMLRLIAMKGSEHNTSAVVANALELSPAGVSWPNHQVALREMVSRDMHGFAISRGSGQDILLTFRSTSTYFAFRAHRDGTLVRAYTFDYETQHGATRTPADAQADFTAQCTYWIENADSLTAPPQPDPLAAVPKN